MVGQEEFHGCISLFGKNLRHCRSWILFDKLNLYDVRSTSNNWFRSYIYLANRRQSITIEGASSDFSNVTYGVQQGSILDPLLFIVHINDLNTVFKILRTILCLLMILICSCLALIWTKFIYD